MSLTVQQFPTMSAALGCLAQAGPVCHWSFGIAHPDSVAHMNHIVFAREIVPTLAREYGVRHFIDEALPRDLPSSFFEWIGAQPHIPTFAQARKVLKTTGLQRRIVKDGIAGSKPKRIAQLSPLEVFGACAYLPAAVFELFRAVHRLRVQDGIQIYLHGAKDSLGMEVCYRECWRLLGIDLPLFDEQRVQKVTNALRTRSLTVLKTEPSVAMMSGAYHNCDLEGLDAASRADAAADTIIPVLVERMGRAAVLNVYLLIPEVEVEVITSPERAARAHAQRAQQLATAAQRGSIALSRAHDDAWTYLMMPPRSF